jgi:hypothetical protein
VGLGVGAILRERSANAMRAGKKLRRYPALSRG